MKEIPLTQGKVALVDDEDFERVSQYKWYYDKQKNTAKRSITISQRTRKPEYLSQLLCPVQNKKTGIKYFDGNSLNFQKNNMLVLSVSYLYQGTNRKKNRKLTSEYVGVSWAKNAKKWLVAISFQKKPIYIGIFDKELEAAAAYNKKAIELYGPNAKLNPLPLEEN